MVPPSMRCAGHVIKVIYFLSRHRFCFGISEHGEYVIFISVLRRAKCFSFPFFSWRMLLQNFAANLKLSFNALKMCWHKCDPNISFVPLSLSEYVNDNSEWNGFEAFMTICAREYEPQTEHDKNVDRDRAHIKHSPSWKKYRMKRKRKKNTHKHKNIDEGKQRNRTRIEWYAWIFYECLH